MLLPKPQDGLRASAGYQVKARTEKSPHIQQDCLMAYISKKYQDEQLAVPVRELID